jgi:RNA ligase
MKERYDQLVTDSWMIKQRHPSLDLTIYNYSQYTQYESYWTPETISARGLVINDAGTIVARPFGKFFNLAEHDPSEIPNLTFEVFEKMDGSLGILFSYQGQWVFASRGSFTSEQAEEGSKMLQAMDLSGLDPEFTYLFEIIYPSNRICVDYGDTRDLVMLAAIHTQSGQEMSYLDMWEIYGQEFTIVKAYPSGTSLSDLQAFIGTEESNREGYVIRFSNGFRVKMKFEEYVRLHRIVTQVSSISIWDMLRKGESLDAIIDHVPDEFYQWVKEIIHEMTFKREEILSRVRAEYQVIMTQLGSDPSRKSIAIAFSDSQYRSYLFGMLDDKNEVVEALAWKQVKPEHSTPFKSSFTDH